MNAKLTIMRGKSAGNAFFLLGLNGFAGLILGWNGIGYFGINCSHVAALYFFLIA
jgi:hypothetical protein